MFKKPATSPRRIFTPRIFFYLFFTLITAWLMHRHAQRMQEVGLGEVPASKNVENALAPIPFKESELSVPVARKQPMLLLIAAEQAEVRDLQKTLAEEFRETCSVLFLNIEPDPTVLKLFAVEQTPAMLLFDVNNQEKARWAESALPSANQAADWLRNQLNAKGE